MRKIDAREMVHERLAGTFSDLLSTYDTQRRVETLVDDFLGRQRLSGRKVLDVGCGLGFFSKRLSELGARVTACDLGAELLRQTAGRANCETVLADAMNLVDSFAPDSFDVVVSSECIEHTPDPYGAVRQMIKVLKPGGYVSISTPNIVWWPVVKVATIAGLRPFDGLENFSTWRGLRKTLRDQGVEIVEERGLHLFPFQLGLDRASTWIDRNCQFMKPAMINICLLGRKLPSGDAAATTKA